ncbi:uncharacterized protein LOC115627399 [Scaptodrosophila lebanonensis]|uniref:Uncharacterized protein LOC115627399 n=1 Tax=Drosophila lebanonensis TaxID=7225 RepID=A0A6J2TS70_DROLE|nr:uncharacterized protein LOC115627399 [Scaptodrosophila lebanonensis]
MSSMWQHYALALIVLKAMLLAAMAAPTTTTTAATATWMTPTLTTKSKDGDADTQQQWVNSQPVYELQLVVWPDDIEDGDDVGNSVATTVEATATTTTTTTRKPFSTTNASPLLPLYEDQLVVFPQMDFEEENLDYFFDDLPVSVAQPAPAPATGTTTTSTTTTTVKPLSTRPTIPAVAVAPSESLVYVLEDYHVVHPNGTAEYKLALSNGLVNYKKMYNKLVGDQVINVQEGYDSVPIPGREHEYQTQYYIADENGFNVYKIEHNYRVPVLPNYLHYKAKNVAAEATM